MSLFLFLAACSDYKITAQSDETQYAPVIELRPQQLSFGGVEEGDTLTKSFIISNSGNAALEVLDLTLETSADFAILTDPSEYQVMIDPDSDGVEIEVAFTSIGRDASGTILVSSDDPRDPEVTVDLLATNSSLLFDPNPYDFGNLTLGDSSEGSVSLSNIGTVEVTLEEIYADGDGFDAWADFELPYDLGVGESVNLGVRYSSSQSGSFTGQVVADHSSGSDAGELQVSVEGSGPVAVCSVNPSEVQPIHDSATWIGADSYDADGLEIIDYAWALTSQPSGSTARMPGGIDADRPGFVPDVAGSYVGTLTVTNSEGTQSQCSTTLEAIPGEDLWVEMFWTMAGDDMDLHLLKPGGFLEDRQTDCYYANCVGGLDWGVRGDTQDDPSLDLDDINNTGPENINLGSPEDGVFTVYVHDYPGSRYNPANSVTVKIYMGGSLAWQDTRDISGEDVYEPFAEINWSTGDIITR